MKYSEIMNALNAGKAVHWCHTGYMVVNEGSKLYLKMERNGYYSGLQESEYNDCFIG